MKKILYLSYRTDLLGSAQSVNSQRRIIALEKAGFHVIQFIHSPSSVIKDTLHLLWLLFTVDCINIRIDGSNILDKFTLLKGIRWGIKIVWEIHGFPEENNSSVNQKAYILNLIKRNIKQRLLSTLVDRYIFVSPELQQYALGKIALKKCVVISNFVLSSEITELSKKPHTPVATYLNHSGYFKVVWAGNTKLSWQAVDKIERVAKLTYTKDRSIIFIIIGSDDQSLPKWNKNILTLGRLSRQNTLRIIAHADACLALYHKPPYVPFYFVPLKILDYMMLKKPIIATNTSTIRSLIQNTQNGLLTENATSDIISKLLLLKNNSKFSKKLGSQAFRSVISKHLSNRAIASYQFFLSSLFK